MANHPRSSILLPIESACNFRLVSNSNFVCVHVYLLPFSIYGRTVLENSLFSHLTLVWCPLAEERACDINVIYTPLESTFNANGPQFRRRQYGIIVVGSQSHIYEISRNSERIRANSSSVSSKFIDLAVNRKRLPINNNYWLYLLPSCLVRWSRSFGTH